MWEVVGNVGNLFGSLLKLTRAKSYLRWKRGYQPWMYACIPLSTEIDDSLV